MSLDASRWAWKQRIPKNEYASPAAIKIVLLSMADRADENNLCYPSVKRLEIDTELNRKTIQASLSFLKAAPIIEDTGKRVGRTSQIVVYRLLGVDNREDSLVSKQPENGTVPDSDALEGNEPENGPVNESDSCNSTEDGGLEVAQKRNCSKNGTVPDLPPKGPENGLCKEAQIWATEPISLEPTIEPDINTCANSCASESEKLSTDKPEASASERWCGAKSKKPLTRNQQTLFAELWNAYQHKKDRAKSIDAFLKYVLPLFGSEAESNRNTLNMLLAAIKREVAARDSKITPLYFERWITNRRWEDEPTGAAATPSSDDGAVPMWRARGFQSEDQFTKFNQFYSTYTQLKSEIRDENQERLFEEARVWLNDNRPTPPTQGGEVRSE